MTAHTLAQRLAESVPPECRAAVEGAVLKEFSDSILVVWTVEDVHSALADDGKTVTDEEAYDLLRRADLRHDANDGINWDVLRSHA